jgi:hypothetical protein
LAIADKRGRRGQWGRERTVEGGRGSLTLRGCETSAGSFLYLYQVKVIEFILTLFEASCKLRRMQEGFMLNNRPIDLIPVSEARKLLGVSPAKMSQLIRDGIIRHYPDLLDKRVKLVSEAEVTSLKRGRKAA